jgi:hypothetical protein
MYGQQLTMRRRVAKSVWALAVNLVIWVIVPYYIGTLLANRVPDTPLTIPAFVYEFGVLFIILDVGAAFFTGMVWAVPLITGAALLGAVYLWLVANGGVLTFSAGGTSISLEFQLILYLLVIPPLWAAVRAPISYLIWKRDLTSHPMPA